jgi:hypothetical protein
VASRRQLEEPLIFQGEIQQDVSRADAKQQEQKEDAFSNNAHGKEHRHKTESVNARTEHGKESAGPIEPPRVFSPLLPGCKMPVGVNTPSIIHHPRRV